MLTDLDESTTGTGWSPGDEPTEVMGFIPGQPTGDGPAPAKVSWPDDRPSHGGYVEPWN